MLFARIQNHRKNVIILTYYTERIYGGKRRRVVFWSRNAIDIFYTLREYTAEKDDELSFGQGMPLKVIQKSKSGWWTVRYAGVYLKVLSL